MYDRELTQYAHALAYAERLLADLSDDQMLEQPTAGMNHPTWLVGHLTAVTDHGLEMLGLPPAVPKEWHALFDTGTVPSPERDLYPPKAQLLAGYRAAHERLAAAVRERARPDLLDRVNPFDSLKATLPTLADLLAYLLTVHEAVHLGQISNWRRQLGMAAV